MKTKTIRQRITFNANPDEIYETLMNPEKHYELTQNKAEISKKIGEHFSLYAGKFYGTNIELIQDKKIVQEWHSQVNDWPKNHKSTIILVFRKIEDKKTELHFTHKNVPIELYEIMKKNWHKYYWQLLKKKFKKKSYSREKYSHSFV